MVYSSISLGHVPNIFKLSIIKPLLKTHSRALDWDPTGPSRSLAGAGSFTFPAGGMSKIYHRSRDWTRIMKSTNGQKRLKWVCAIQNQNKSDFWANFPFVTFKKNGKDLDFVSCNKYTKLLIYNAVLQRQSAVTMQTLRFFYYKLKPWPLMWPLTPKM